MKAAYLALVSLLFSGVALAQGPAGESDTSAPPAVFRTGVDLVALNVIVTDPQQNFVTGLAAENFLVFEDGVQQDVSFFAAKNVPLDLAIMLDTSASMTDKMQTVQEAAIGFASTLREGDRITVVDIKDSVKVLHALGADPGGAPQAIRATTARGGTALYNGLYMTIKEMVKQRRTNGEVRRQAIVVLSDGEDTASLMGFDDVMEVAKQSGISIYTITLRSAYLVKAAAASGQRYFSQAEFGMKALAQETGARAFFPVEIQELAGVYGSIAQELAAQYALGYTSKNPKRDGAYRRVIVRVDQPGARTRTRAGYQSPRAERAVRY